MARQLALGWAPQQAPSSGPMQAQARERKSEEGEGAAKRQALAAGKESSREAGAGLKAGAGSEAAAG